ncbi:MAG TPA: hypothetical protein VFP84_06630 [Kofleriaceae bacterium]|nr:hypothetical protein [Kofleriaceae bacterium]
MLLVELELAIAMMVGAVVSMVGGLALEHVGGPGREVGRSAASWRSW